MDLGRLREETRHEHEATEAAMPLTGPGLKIGTYQAVLRLLLPVLRSWETWAAENAPARVQPLLPARHRSGWIAQDLETLGEVYPGLKAPAPVLNEAPFDAPVDWSAVVFGDPHAESAAAGSMEREAAFLGAFYVIEGSTLGGRFIARHVETTLGLQPGQGDAYFRGHGEHTGAMWRETTEALVALPEQVAGETIAAAKRTFQAFGAILGTLPR